VSFNFGIILKLFYCLRSITTLIVVVNYVLINWISSKTLKYSCNQAKK